MFKYRYAILRTLPYRQPLEKSLICQANIHYMDYNMEKMESLVKEYIEFAKAHVVSEQFFADGHVEIELTNGKIISWPSSLITETRMAELKAGLEDLDKNG